MPVKSGGYKSAERFILSRELFGMKLGLENIAGFLQTIGNPQLRLRAIHIAGTNGKGSTAAYLEAILRRSGYSTGLFTSPHLIDFRERIRIDGDMIERRYITNFIKKYKPLIARRKITFFEVCTALAFSYFADRGIDIAIIETGLGGRLDATNTLAPLLSIITDISYDHTAILGDTLEKIAFEKAGIIKPGIPLLIGLLPDEARRVIERISLERKADLYSLGAGSFTVVDKPFVFSYDDGQRKFDNLQSSLPGIHQVTNAALAIRALGLLAELGLKVKKSSIPHGLLKTDWPGRFQIIRQNGKPTLVLDVGHNPAGAAAIADCFRELFPGRKADMIIGLLGTKDLAGTIGPLADLVKRVAVVPLKTRRSADPEEIAAHFRRLGVAAETAASMVGASRRMIRKACPDDIIIICGSHYGVGEFLANLKRPYEEKRNRKKEK